MELCSAQAMSTSVTPGLVFVSLTKEGLKTAKKTGAFRTKVVRVCVCVCVGSSDLATVLIIWGKFRCNYSDLTQCSVIWELKFVTVELSYSSVGIADESMKRKKPKLGKLQCRCYKFCRGRFTK